MKSGIIISAAAAAMVFLSMSLAVFAVPPPTATIIPAPREMRVTGGEYWAKKPPTMEKVDGIPPEGYEARRTPVFKPHSVVPDSLDKYSCEHGAFVFVNNILGGNPRFKDEVQGQQQRSRPARRPIPAEVDQQVIVDITDQNMVECEASTDKEKEKCLQR